MHHQEGQPSKSPPADKRASTLHAADADPGISSGPQRPRKRRQEDDGQQSKSKIQSRATAPQLPHFACPFYRRHWAENKACLRYRLNRIADVRQHLRRAHMWGPYCPKCWLEFSNEEERIVHVRKGDCEVAPLPILDRMSDDQEREIFRAGSNRQARSSVADKWYEIWDILFPGYPRPTSPYVDESPIVQELIDLRERLFSSDEWEKLLPDPPRLLDAMDHPYRLASTRHIIDKFIDFVGDSGGAEARYQPGGERETQAHTPKSSVEQTPSVLVGHALPTEGLEQSRDSLESSPQVIMPPVVNESPLYPYETPTVDTHSARRALAVPSRLPKHSDFNLRAQPAIPYSRPFAPESNPMRQPLIDDLDLVWPGLRFLPDEEEEDSTSTKYTMCTGL